MEVNQDGYEYQATCTFNSPAFEQKIRFLKIKQEGPYPIIAKSF
ncbi:hypothetical protein [Pseudobacillus wudalianchiensis]|nr:hypothetical protein [Bacillus wudalianchiensis]